MDMYFGTGLLFFVLIAGSALADDFTISGAATTTNDGNTVDGGDTITVTNSGSVTTTDISALDGTGNGISIASSGTITTQANSGATAHGMIIVGDNGSLANSGVLDSGKVGGRRTRATHDAMMIIGDNGTITNSGIIGSRFRASRYTSINYEGHYGTILNSGTISAGSVIYTGDYGKLISTGAFTSGGSEVGLRYFGDFGLIDNRSTTHVPKIRYTGAHGIIHNHGQNTELRYIGDNGQVLNTWVNDGSNIRNTITYIGDFGTATNDGGIISWGGGNDGLAYQGSTGTIINNGTVTTIQYAYGMSHAGNFGTIINNGTVTTAFFYRGGLFHSGQSGTIVNRGRVTTAGFQAHGIHHTRSTVAPGDFGTIRNTGVVETSGDEGHGLFHDGGTGTISNSGRVSVTGALANALHTVGTGNTVTNAGRLSSTNGLSVFMSGDNATLHLRAGSRLIGKVHFVNPATATLHFGRGLNAVVKLDSTASLPNTITAHRDAYRVVGDTIYVVDTNGFAASSRGIGAITGFVASRVSHHQQFGSSGSRANATGPRVSTKGTDPGQYWFETFGNARMGTSTDDYSAITGGIVLGFDTSPGQGFFTGIGSGYANSVTSSFTSRNSNVFAGGYFQTSVFGLPADVSLTAGIAATNGARTFGAETASSAYSNYFVSPAITFSGTRPIGTSNLTFSLGARYTALYQQGYTETGSTANLTVSPVATQIFELRALATAEGAAKEWAKGTFFPSVYAGIEGQVFLGGAVSSSVAGSTIAFSSTGDNNAARVFAGINAVLVKKDTSEVRSGFEYGMNTQGVISTSAFMRWDIRF